MIGIARFSRVLIVMALMFAAVNTAHARVAPFKVSGIGVAEFIPLPGEQAYHVAVGRGTHLGRYFGLGIVRADMFTSESTASFSSAVPFVFVGEGGSRLACHYGRTDLGATTPGHVQLFPAEDGKFTSVWVAEFRPVPELCTGRFRNITGGSFFMIARTEAFVLGAKDPVGYSWSGEGFLKWGNGRNNWKGSASGSTAPDPDQPGIDCDVFNGISSKVGKFTAEGCHASEPSLALAGYAVWTAKNGDKLNITYTGQIYFTGDPVTPFAAVFNLIANGGTGRFKNARGAAHSVGAFTGVPGDFTFEFEGTLRR